MIDYPVKFLKEAAGYTLRIFSGTATFFHSGALISKLRYISFVFYHKDHSIVYSLLDLICCAYIHS
ncbi:hypothetical protein JOC77_001593 [Peribacillus deserti]|uniref:Uncharacterized protein n=1 Tax=Peribacillus deserti TaxID=673318 RepID=A0ABS2QG77_9BACI|nr:hypothetical protein [Peribacillus deserti]